MKIRGSIERNIDFEAENFEVRVGYRGKTHRKTSILKIQSVKSGGGLAQNARFEAPTCLVSGLCFSPGFAVSMEEAAKPFLFACVTASCHVVLRGKHGTY